MTDCSDCYCKCLTTLWRESYREMKRFSLPFIQFVTVCYLVWPSIAQEDWFWNLMRVTFLSKSVKFSAVIELERGVPRVEKEYLCVIVFQNHVLWFHWFQQQHNSHKISEQGFFSEALLDTNWPDQAKSKEKLSFLCMVLSIIIKIINKINFTSSTSKSRLNLPVSITFWVTCRQRSQEKAKQIVNMGSKVRNTFPSENDNFTVAGLSFNERYILITM